MSITRSARRSSSERGDFARSKATSRVETAGVVAKTNSIPTHSYHEPSAFVHVNGRASGKRLPMKALAHIQHLENFLSELRERKVKSLATLQKDVSRHDGQSNGQHGAKGESGSDDMEKAMLKAQLEDLRRQVEKERAGRILAEKAAAAAGDTTLETMRVAEPTPGRLAPDVYPRLLEMKKVVSQLQKDKGHLEAVLLEMYESFFSKKFVKEVTQTLKRMESAQSASSPTIKVSASKSRALEQAALRAEEMSKELADAKDELAALSIKHEYEMQVMTVESKGQIEHLQRKFEAESGKRRQLQEQLLELKGNIRVFCRVRPLLDMECDGEPGEKATAVKVKDKETLVLMSNRHAGEQHQFEFDCVFPPESTQQEVFKEAAALVISALDGYNVCIMAYGQTGSGKTFTMEGSPSNVGVNVQALNLLFNEVALRKEDQEMTISASVLEIYNDSVFDLLAATREGALDVKADINSEIIVPGLTSVEVQNRQDVDAVLEKARKSRSTYATNMNEHSSRSHLILLVVIDSTNNADGSRTRSKLHLIDLAGSERISRSNAQGDRLKEVQNINSSLSALGDTIQALQSNQRHIPYRNSRLTRLLQDSLGGSSKTLLFVNISPAVINANETKCSLEFASRARKVELGEARKHILPTASSGAAAAAAAATVAAEGSASASASASAGGSRDAAPVPAAPAAAAPPRREPSGDRPGLSGAAAAASGSAAGGASTTPPLPRREGGRTSVTREGSSATAAAALRREERLAQTKDGGPGPASASRRDVSSSKASSRSSSASPAGRSSQSSIPHYALPRGSVSKDGSAASAGPDSDRHPPSTSSQRPRSAQSRGVANSPLPGKSTKLSGGVRHSRVPSGSPMAPRSGGWTG